MHRPFTCGARAVVVCEAKVVADGVGHVAGQDVGLEGVDVDADADGADGADATHVGDGCLTRLVAPTTATITAVIVQYSCHISPTNMR